MVLTGNRTERSSLEYGKRNTLLIMPPFLVIFPKKVNKARDSPLSFLRSENLYQKAVDEGTLNIPSNYFRQCRLNDPIRI
jgi:hypothetical protein